MTTHTPDRGARSAATLIWWPFRKFAQLQSASSLLLILCTLAALAWANSPWGTGYHHFREFPIGLNLGGKPMTLNLELFVNDALMAVFFLLVGLEIKREMLAGELASLRQSALPIVAALGGMLVPAGIYVAVNHGQPGAHGWGIPMATDIAFALGVMTLLGKRVPTALKVFLVALAIIDDIGAILVIALFYTSKLNLPSLLAAFALLAALAGMNRSGVRHPAPYLIGGLLLWIAVFHSGIHATIAGVALAFCIPHKPRLREEEFAPRMDAARAKYDAGNQKAGTILDDQRVEAIHEMEDACEGVEPLLQRLESKLHPYVVFGILPLFALMNAGVELSPSVTHTLVEPLGLGIILGLCLGKPLGITLFSWLAVRLRLATKPHGVTWAQVAGAGVLGGIGFTMSIFIAGLGLPNADLLDGAKLAVLTASVISGVGGFLLLRFLGSRHRPAAESRTE
jgi:NhaA family Na+:H+ antiporter